MFFQNLDRAPFVRRIDAGIDVADGNGFDALVDQFSGGGNHVVFRQVRNRPAVGAHPFAHLEPVAPGYQRFGLFPRQIEHRRRPDAPDFEDVAEAPRRDQPGAGAGFLQDRV